MDRIPIKSSSIVSAGWDGKDMEVQFSSQAVYLYRNVPKKVWDEFQTVKSKGMYFAACIRSSYVFECVYRPPKVEKEKTNGETVEGTEKKHKAGESRKDKQAEAVKKRKAGHIS